MKSYGIFYFDEDCIIYRSWCWDSDFGNGYLTQTVSMHLFKIYCVLDSDTQFTGWLPALESQRREKVRLCARGFFHLLLEVSRIQFSCELSACAHTWAQRQAHMHTPVPINSRVIQSFSYPSLNNFFKNKLLQSLKFLPGQNTGEVNCQITAFCTTATRFYKDCTSK